MQQFEISEEERKRLAEIRETFYNLAEKIFPLVPNKNGILEFQERRFVFLNALTFSKVHEALGKVMGSAMRKQLLFRFGEKAGEDVANMFLHASLKEGIKLLIKTHFDLSLLEKVKGTSVLEQASKILAYGKYVGWIGEAEITHYNDFPGYVRIVMKNTFESFALKEQNPSEPVCVFLSGVIQGIFKTLTGNKNVRTKEVKCQACGDEYCEFIVEEGEKSGN